MNPQGLLPSGLEEQPSTSPAQSWSGTSEGIDRGSGKWTLSPLGHRPEARLPLCEGSSTAQGAGRAQAARVGAAVAQHEGLRCSQEPQSGSGSEHTQLSALLLSFRLGHGADFVTLRKESHEAWPLLHPNLLSSFTSSIFWLLWYCQPWLLLLIQ